MPTLAALDEAGFAELPGVLTPERCVDVAGALDATGGRRPGTRNLLDLSCCQELAATLRAHAAIASLLPPRAVAVQCTLFHKSAETNWLVGLPQGLSIPV